MTVRKWYMPEYFNRFVCKADKCRNTCCSGWNIPVSREEYFRLITAECSEDLNRRIQSAFILPEVSTESSYRLIGFNWQGYCPVMEKGLCKLHAEKGEQYLPKVCRLYPRSYKRLNENYIACCSSSCERVLEMLYEADEFRVIQEELDQKPQIEHDLDADESSQMFWFQQIMKDRSRHLEGRIAEVCSRINEREFTVDYQSTEEPLNEALAIIRRLSDSNSFLEDAGKRIIQRYENDPQQYYIDRERFDESFPDWSNFFEKIINNSLIYETFPYVDKRFDRTLTYKGLCCCYGLLRVLCIGYMSEHEAVADLIDITAALFHLVEHTAFYYNANILADNAAIMLKL